MKRLALIAAAVALVALGVVSPPQRAIAATHAAHVADKTFVDGGGCSPSGGGSTTIHAGDSIVWHNCDAFAHKITADDFSFTRTLAANGDTAPVTFNQASPSIPYHCDIHPEMVHGAILVEPAQTTSTKPAPTTTTTATTIKPTTTSPSTSTSTTQTTQDLNGLFDGSSTTSSSSTTSTTELAINSDGKDGSGSGLVIALLILAIGGVGAGAYAVWRRMQQATQSS